MADQPDAHPLPRSDDFGVTDGSFINYLDRLKRLHNFVYEEAVKMEPSVASSLQMGNLHRLYYRPDGRMPTVEEWNQVERQTQDIYIIITPALRKKFLMAGTPTTLVWLPVLLIIDSIISVAIPVWLNGIGWLNTAVLLGYFVWSGCLGGLGALAFIGMNALSIQDDITFDLTNERLVTLRIVLGALFAIIIDLPMGYPAFFYICIHIVSQNFTADSSGGYLSSQAVWLLAPLVFGFSTSSVILILNRLVDAAQSFFGQKPGEAEKGGISG